MTGTLPMCCFNALTEKFDRKQFQDGAHFAGRYVSLPFQTLDLMLSDTHETGRWSATMATRSMVTLSTASACTMAVVTPPAFKLWVLCSRVVEYYAGSVRL